MDQKTLFSRISAAGQQHLLVYWDKLSEPERTAYAAQLEGVDFESLPKLINDYVINRPKVGIPSDLGPSPYFPLVPRDAAQTKLYADARLRGAELLRQGKVSCLTVAGGQGTRLGFNAPKGTYPIGPVSGRPLFRYFAESIARTGEKYGKPITWYIMTSLLNREATEQFFKDNGFFGLAPEQVFFFTQGTMPAICYDGKLIMASLHSLALSPDGHGGTLLALRKSGALDRMKAEGVEYLSYFQVDNPLVKVADPFFVGLHALENSQMSAIMLAKTNPYEKLGNFCVSGGRLEIIEYSDLPKDLAESRNADGSLRFIAGSPAIHIISRDFVEKLTAGGSLKLPWHRADKKIGCIDAKGNPVTPAEPNGVKLESFIFDALPLAERTMVLEADRAMVFAPTKNATGVDSVESCRAMLIERDARYLESAGVRVPRRNDGTVDARFELSPRRVIDVEDAAAYVAAHGLNAIAPGAECVMD